MTIDFAAFIDKQIEQNPVEARILRKIIRALKNVGDPIVSVFDGDERNAVRTERDIFEQVFNLDGAWLYTKSGAFVFFVGGNEWEVISDYSVSLESSLQPVMDYIKKYEE